MTRTNSLEANVVMLGFIALIGIVALLMLGPALIPRSGGTITVARQVNVTAPRWLEGREAKIPEGLTITSHAKKHQGEALDAWKIYALLLQGQCVASARYCNADGVQLYLCVDPATGLIGGLVVADNIIRTGYGSGAVYWGEKVRGQDAPFQPEFCYVH